MPAYKSAAGATVFVEPDWSASNTTELAIAKNIADFGMDVILRTKIEEEGVKTSDSFVRMPSGWEEWEFKTIDSSGTSLHTSIQRNLREGRLQAGVVVLYLPTDVEDRGGLQQVVRGIVSALRHDNIRRLQRIVLMTTDGKIQLGDIDAIRNGEFQFAEF